VPLFSNSQNEEEQGHHKDTAGIDRAKERVDSGSTGLPRDEEKGFLGP